MERTTVNFRDFKDSYLEKQDDASRTAYDKALRELDAELDKKS